MVSLQSLLGKRMAFGTAGLRGPMGPGYAQMNNLVVMQTAQGLIQYILNDLGESAKQMVIKFINIYLYFSY
jgi:phosphomannomutase